MLLHYFMGKFQAVKPVTEHTRRCVRADRAQWSQRGAGMLLRSSPLLFPHPEGRAVPSLLRLTWSLPFLAEEISVPTSLRMRAGHPLKKAGPRTSATSAASGTNPKSAYSPYHPELGADFLRQILLCWYQGEQTDSESAFSLNGWMYSSMY